MTVRTPGPARHPEPPAELVGRASELAELRAALAQSSASRPVVLTGMPGVGKTALAATLAAEYPHVAWLDPGARRSAVSARSAGPDDEHPELPAGVGLLVLEDAAVEQPLPELFDGQHVLVTTRTEPPHGRWPTTLRLDPLADEAAVQLLRGQLGTTLDDAELAQLAEPCGGLPLSLTALAAAVAERPGWSVQDHLDLWRPDGVLPDVVCTRLNQAAEGLSAGLRAALAVLAEHPGPDWDAAAMAALWGVPEPIAQRQLAELAAHHLVARAGQGRWGCHPTIRAYARQQLRLVVAPSALQAAGRRLARHYLAAAEPRVARLYPARLPSTAASDETAEAANEWLRRETPNLLATAQLAVDSGDHDATIRYTKALGPVLANHRGAELAPLARAARNAAEIVGDPAEQVSAEIDLGFAEYDLGHFATARNSFDRALSWAIRSSDGAGQVVAREGVIRCSVALGDYPEQIVQLRRLVALSRAEGDTTRLAERLTSLAAVYLRIGADEEVIDATGEAIQVALQAAAPVMALNAQTLAFRAALRLGDLSAARAYLADALAASESAGDDYSTVAVAVMQARMTAIDESMGVANPDFEDAVGRAAQFRAPYAVAQAELLWGEALLIAGELAAARPHFELIRQSMGPTGADYLMRLAEVGLAACDGAPVEWSGYALAVPGTPAPPSVLDPLSSRERQVAELVADGLSNQQIASNLGISPRTVEDHVGRICRKLGVRSRSAIGRKLAED